MQPWNLSMLLNTLLFFRMMDIESMNRYVSPINPAVFPHLTVVLLGIGIFFMAWFFVYPFGLILWVYFTVMVHVRVYVWVSLKDGAWETVLIAFDNVIIDDVYHTGHC